MQSFTCVLVLENEPKLKETTVNYFESRHHQSIEEYTRDNGELVNQDAKIVWASLLSSLEVSRYDYLFHDCPLAGNTRRLLEILSDILYYFESRHHQSIEEYTRDNGEVVNQDAKIVWASLLSSLEVSRYDCLFHDCPLAGNTRRLIEILSVILFGNL